MFDDDKDVAAIYTEHPGVDAFTDEESVCLNNLPHKLCALSLTLLRDM